MQYKSYSETTIEERYENEILYLKCAIQSRDEKIIAKNKEIAELRESIKSIKTNSVNEIMKLFAKLAEARNTK